MAKIAAKYTPLISVIIPCFNHGNYLAEAVESVWMQNYPSTEVIVVNDGSTDNTEEIAKQLAGIKYIYQKNQGLSAARNTGIRNSTGEFFIFLDADDWLLPGAIDINVNYLIQNEALAFVSGAHEWVTVEDGKSIDVSREINADHYLYLLQGNYIGMHATVMYRRWVFDHFLFDETLKACEDYDLYLKIARKFPVSHHTHKIAAYRIHGTNMSWNIPMMLSNVLKVLDRQKASLQTTREKEAYKYGQKNWKKYYSSELYTGLSSNKLPVTVKTVLLLLELRPKRGLKFILKKSKSMLKSFMKNNMPSIGKRWLHKTGRYKSWRPDAGNVNTGDFNSLVPFSTQFGYDRGGPVDRYYIENFLKKEAEHIKGRCLEIGDNEYSLLYGGSKLTQSDILHIDETNTKATFIGDLSNAPQVPDNAFDCIVLTQTLHLIYDFKGALATCHRILKPGGVLLLTSPGITPIDHGEWKKTWYWSFTDKALIALIAEAFPNSNAEVETFGNVHVASAFLYGMGVTEIPVEKLDYMDPHFQVIITVKATKGARLVKSRIINKIKNLFAHKAIVLMYHRIAEPESDVWEIAVSPERFEQHLQILQKMGNVVPLEQLADAVNAKSLSKNWISIAFDDGYLDNFKTAKPLLEKYGMPATFFIASGNVERENEFFWDELERLILFSEHLPALFSMTINEHSIIFDLKDEGLLTEKIAQKHRSWKACSEEPPTLRAGLFYRIWEQLKCLPYIAQQYHLQLVKKWAGSSLPARPDYRTMSVSELKQMAANNLFTIGSHTVTHPALANHNAQFQKEELTENRLFLQEVTGQAINLLAYPYGIYNKETLQIASDLGFKAAFTTEEKPIEVNSSIYTLGRFQVMNLTGTALINQLNHWRQS